MSRRSIISLAASAIIGIGCIAMISTDAFAYRGGRAGVHRGGAYHGGVPPGGVCRGDGGVAAVLLPSALLPQRPITRHAADTILTHLATKTFPVPGPFYGDRI